MEPTAQAIDPHGSLAQHAVEVISGCNVPGVRRIVVGAVTVRQRAMGDHLLLLRRRSNLQYGGIEELPSGAVEDRETLGEALAREVLEETGLRIGTSAPFLFEFSYPSRKGLTLQLNYLVRAPASRTVRLGSEHESFRWISISSIEASELTEPVKAGLREAFVAVVAQR